MIRCIILTNPKIYRTRNQQFTSRFDKYVPERYQPFWHHPAGPQTIFFWAPLFKWGLVCAGISDLKRDPETLSKWQTFSLMVSGLLWSRYSVIIVPKNYLLFSVNMFVFLTQAVQFYRICSIKSTK